MYSASINVSSSFQCLHPASIYISPYQCVPIELTLSYASINLPLYMFFTSTLFFHLSIFSFVDVSAINLCFLHQLIYLWFINVFLLSIFTSSINVLFYVPPTSHISSDFFMIYLCSPFSGASNFQYIIWFVQLEFSPTVYVISVYQCSLDLSIFHSSINISMTYRFSLFIDVSTFHNCFLQCTSNFQHIFWSVYNHLLMFLSYMCASFIHICSRIFLCFLHLPMFFTSIDVFSIYRCFFPYIDVFFTYRCYLHLSICSPSIDIFSIYRCFLHLTMFSPSTDVFSIYWCSLHPSIISTSIDLFSIYRSFLHLSMFCPFIDVFSIYRCFLHLSMISPIPFIYKIFFYIHITMFFCPLHSLLPHWYFLQSSLGFMPFWMVRWPCSFDLPMICLYIDYLLIY